MLNERTLFIDEARYGKRAPATDPMTAAPTPSPPVKQEAQPEAAKSPLAGPLPPQPAKPGRTMAELGPCLTANAGLDDKMFGHWKAVNRGMLPKTREARLALFASLSDAERYLLMTGGRA